MFLKNKGEKVHKTSNNDDIKFVTVRQPKTASNLLNSIKQSNIITKELETIEKPNIFHIESVTIEHPKTVIKLSKPIKHQQIIIRQPKKIKVYAESKAAHLTLQLDTIKIHIPPKNC